MGSGLRSGVRCWGLTIARGLLIWGEVCGCPEKLLLTPKYLAIRSSIGRWGGGAGGFPRGIERDRRRILEVSWSVEEGGVAGELVVVVEFLRPKYLAKRSSICGELR